MKLLLTLLTIMFLLTHCSDKEIGSNIEPDTKLSINCEEAALVACLCAERLGYITQIEIQKTPWSDKGIYHSQCQVQIDNEWKYVTLDKWPTIILNSHREYQEGVEYWSIDKLYSIARK
jgi:hypothetical protein